MANNQYNFLDYAGLSLFWNNVKSIIEENELATASALTDLDTRVDNVESSKSDKGHTHNFGEIGQGVATIGDGANRLMFRTNSNYKNGIYYSTPGNEALVFGTIDPMTSWIFATVDPTLNTAWTSLTPSLQIKNGRVTINKLIANNTDASYNLDVNGSANATTLYENGVRVSVDGHTHTKSQITDFPTSLPANGGYANEIASKGMLDSQEKIDNFITPNRFEYALFKTTDANNVDFASNDGMIISIPWASDSYGFQMAFDDTRNGTIKVRGKSNSWGDWYTLLHSGNYTSYTVKKDGTGASGTWGISITGNATTANNADTVDGYHAGFANGCAAIYAPFPSMTSLKNDGYISSNYGEEGYPDEEFLQGICKWAIATYPRRGDITLMGVISPNSSGTCILHLYSSAGSDPTTNLPRYCRGLYQQLFGGNLYQFGTYNYV